MCPSASLGLSEYVTVHTNTQSSHSVDLAGWQAKMASIEIWIPWRYAHKPHYKSAISFKSSSPLCFAFEKTNKLMVQLWLLTLLGLSAAWLTNPQMALSKWWISLIIWKRFLGLFGTAPVWYGYTQKQCDCLLKKKTFSFSDLHVWLQGYTHVRASGKLEGQNTRAATNVRTFEYYSFEIFTNELFSRTNVRWRSLVYFWLKKCGTAAEPAQRRPALLLWRLSWIAKKR